MEKSEIEQAFHRMSGEILRIAVDVESYLDFFISNYFCTPQSYKTFLLRDLWLVERTGFGRKIDIFKKICKKEGIDEQRVNKIVKAMDFVRDIRNIVAHGEAFVSDIKEGIKLQKRKSVQYKKDELKITDDLVKEIIEKENFSIVEIINLHKELSNPSGEKNKAW